MDPAQLPLEPDPVAVGTPALERWRDAARTGERTFGEVLDELHEADRRLEAPDGLGEHVPARAWVRDGVLELAGPLRPPPRARALPKAPRAVSVLMETYARTADRSRALQWVAGLDTSSGTARGYRIAMCCRPEVMRHRITGEFAWRLLRCRDRACPSCMESKSKVFGARLRAFHRHRTELRDCEGKPVAGSRLFVTLTQTKRPGEGPGRAFERLMDTWRRMYRWRRFGELVQGGVRAVENVWGDPDEWAKHREACKLEGCKRCRKPIREKGWHAHFHMVLELRPDLDVDREEAVEELREKWLELTGGAAAAQHFEALDDTNVGQLAKYCTKPFELDRDHAVKFFRQMARRKMVFGFGTWRRFNREAMLLEDDIGLDEWERGPTFEVLRRAAALDLPVEFFSRERVEPTAGQLEQYVRELLVLDKVEKSSPLHKPRAWQPWKCTWDRSRKIQRLGEEASTVAGWACEHDPWTRMRTTEEPSATVSAREVWRALKKDPRPVWKRDEHAVAAAPLPCPVGETAMERWRSLLAQLRRRKEEVREQREKRTRKQPNGTGAAER